MEWKQSFTNPYPLLAMTIEFDRFNFPANKMTKEQGRFNFNATNTNMIIFIIYCVNVKIDGALYPIANLQINTLF